MYAVFCHPFGNCPRHGVYRGVDSSRQDDKSSKKRPVALRSNGPLNEERPLFRQSGIDVT